MFDDPKKELTDLEATLRALEQKDDDFEAFYAEIFDEFGDKTPVVDDITEAPLKAAHLKDVRPAGDSAYADQEKEQPAKQDKAVRNLSIIVILELLGIAGVAAFWFFRLM